MGIRIGTGVTLDELSADAVDFDPTDIRLRATDVQAAIKELREKNAYVPDINIVTLNGTKVLTNTSLFQQQYIGSATGYSVQLPDGTTMFTGERFELINATDESIEIKNDSGTVVYSLIPSSVLTVYNTSNTTTDGGWQFTEVSGSATGIQSYVITSNTDFTTSSATDIDITSFSVVPVSGRYFVVYTADIEISQNNKLTECVIHGETVNENTRRVVQGVSSNFKSTQTTTGEVTMLGTNTVHIKVNVSGGSVTIGQRSLVLIRLGS